MQSSSVGGHTVASLMPYIGHNFVNLPGVTALKMAFCSMNPGENGLRSTLLCEPFYALWGHVTSYAAEASTLRGDPTGHI
jgi:hypothetical protein